MISFSPISVHRFLLRAALSAGTIFSWILIFHALHYSGESEIGALVATTLLYVFTHVLTFVLTPLAAQNLGHGTQRSILYATLSLATAYLWLGASSAGVFGSGVGNLWWGILGFAMLVSVYRAFYFVPYKTTVLSSTRPHTEFVLELFLTLVPICASIIITSSVDGAWLMLVGASFLAFLASISLTRISDAYEPYMWGYTETIRQLFSGRNRNMLVSSIQSGVQGAGLLFAWPLAIFLLFDWSYEMLGIIISITLLLSAFGRHVLRIILRALGVHQSRPVRATLAASSWLLRLVIFSPVSVVVADVLYHASVPAKRFGIDQIAHEQAADASHFVDELTALKEMGLALGRISLGILLIVMAFYASPLIALALSLLASAVASVVSVSLPASRRVFI